MWRDNLKDVKSILKEIKGIKKYKLFLFLNAIISSLFGLGIGHGMRYMLKYIQESDFEKALIGFKIFVLTLILENSYRYIKPILIELFLQKTEKKIKKKLFDIAIKNFKILLNCNSKLN